MKKIYGWLKTNKIVSGIIGVTVLLIGVNLILMAQFVSILNSII